MSYDRLDKSSRALRKRRSTGRFSRIITSLAFICIVNVAAIVSILFSMKLSTSDAQAAETVTESNQPGAMQWMEIINTGDMVTIRLDNQLLKGYAWKYGISDSNKIREFRKSESETFAAEEQRAFDEGKWSVSFVPTGKGSGDIEICFFYIKNGRPDDTYTKTIKVNIDNNNRMVVL